MAVVVVAVCAVVEGVSLAVTGIGLWRLTRQLHQLRAARLLDPLTGVLGRTGLLARVDELTGQGQAPGVLLLDLGRFKSVNDEFGHDAGDDLLVAVAHRLTAVASGIGGDAGRLGGDEYVVLLPGGPPETALADVAGRVQQELSVPFHLDSVNATVVVSVTIGAALAEAQPLPGKPFRAADIALYHARQHRQPLAMYRPGMVHPASLQRHGVRLRDLRQAPPVAVFDLDLLRRLVAGEVPSDTAHPDDCAELADLIELIDPRSRDFGTDVQDLARRCVDHRVLQLADPISDVLIEPTVVGERRDGGFRVLTVLAAGPTLASPQLRPDPHLGPGEPQTVAVAVMGEVADAVTATWDLYRATVAGTRP